MDRTEKIAMMNRILDLDRDLSQWKAQEEEKLSEEAAALRQEIFDLHRETERLSEEADNISPDPGIYEAANKIKQKGETRLEELRALYEKEREDLLKDLEKQIFQG